MSPGVHSHSPLGRRAWPAGAACAVAAFALPAPLAARTVALPVSRNPDTPDDAVAALMAGNRRFVNGATTEPHRNLARIRGIAPKQSPFAAILGRADSRVPVELLFDRGFGDLFVVRNAGSVVTAVTGVAA